MAAFPFCSHYKRKYAVASCDRRPVVDVVMVVWRDPIACRVSQVGQDPKAKSYTIKKAFTTKLRRYTAECHK